MNLGNNKIADLVLGSSQVQSAWLGDQIVWTRESPPAQPRGVCFTAQQANSSVKLYKYQSSAPTLDIETSVDDGVTWSAYTQGTSITLANVGDKVWFRAGPNGNTTMSNRSYTNRFSGSGRLAASGDIQYLLSQDGSRQPLADWCFNCLFYGMTTLAEAPACGGTQLSAQECYGGTFERCSGLTEYVKTPLPQMWNDGEYIPRWTYINMFKSCSKLSAVAVNWTSWPMEDAGTAANPGWLDFVASTGVFYCPASLPSKSGEGGIPRGWTRVDL